MVVSLLKYQRKVEMKLKKNSIYAKHIIDVILHLFRQGIPFRGHDETKYSFNQGLILIFISFAYRLNQMFETYIFKHL